ncbi:MAG: DJ-1/PfpI family protein [Candidatus Bipolaricaulis sp.]|nr:DJ-1/PfpI family protein [Candidatus Bipolaricaulis sp.]
MIRRVGLVGVLVVCLLALSLSVAGARRALVLLMPRGAMGVEFFAMLAVFEKAGVSVDVAAPQAGPYLFWEDTAEGVAWGAVGGYEWTIGMTYDDVVLEGYDILILGPGHAHTWWYGKPQEQLESLFRAAVARGMPVAAISSGIQHLIELGLVKNRKVAQPPYVFGVQDPDIHVAMMNEYPVDYQKRRCVYVDLGGPGQYALITGGYACPDGFAEAIVQFLRNH